MSASQRTGARVCRVVALATVIAIGTSCAAAVDPSSLRALSDEPALAVAPPGGTLVASSDAFECLDHSAGEQPTLYREYLVPGTQDEAIASTQRELARLGWTADDVLGRTFTKSVGGQTARIFVGYSNGTIGLNGDVPSVDFCV